jgi:protein-L-isoaspartate(D-aspartate) O-methyltransferase
MPGTNDSNERMIRDQIEARGVTDARVLDAMRSVPREHFVPPHFRSAAFEDSPLPLERGQTISQPYIVGFMTQLLRLQPSDKVLEIGTGSGYQTAVLARLARTVYSAEIEPELGAEVLPRLQQLHIDNVILAVGDGVTVFREHAPFDAILSAAAPLRMPNELLEQLADGGRLVIPVGPADMQHLWLCERKGGEIVRRQLAPVRFVPMRSL